MQGVQSVIKHAIQSFLPDETTTHDADLVARLCIMAAVPTGEENPHDLLRAMSNDTITAFISNMEKVQKNPVSAPIAQFFFIEWCWRNNHLNADWKWEWKNSTEGGLSFFPKEPLEDLAHKFNVI